MSEILKQELHPENEPEKVIYPKTSTDQVEGFEEDVGRIVGDTTEFVRKTELNEDVSELGFSKPADLNMKNGEGDGSVKLVVNKVSGLNSCSLGYNNKVLSDRSFASGGGNYVSGYLAFAFGQNNIVRDWSSGACGSQLITDNGSQFVIGKANAAKYNTIFEIGCGDIQFRQLTIKPSWNDVISSPAGYYFSDDGLAFTKITENNYSERVYQTIPLENLYSDYSLRKNAFDVTEDKVAHTYADVEDIVNDEDIPSKKYIDMKTSCLYAHFFEVILGHSDLSAIPQGAYVRIRVNVLSKTATPYQTLNNIDGYIVSAFGTIDGVLQPIDIFELKLYYSGVGALLTVYSPASQPSMASVIVQTFGDGQSPSQYQLQDSVTKV